MDFNQITNNQFFFDEKTNYTLHKSLKANNYE